MPRRIMLSVFALAVTATAAGAADLPTQSRLGAIFAEPSEVGTRVGRSTETSPQLTRVFRADHAVHPASKSAVESRRLLLWLVVVLRQRPLLRRAPGF